KGLSGSGVWAQSTTLTDAAGLHCRKASSANKRPAWLKKFIRTPEIPSKHVRNWVPKVLEQRRQGLELYLQTVILENEELPKIFLDFLNVRHVPTLPKAESCGSFDETESEESSKLSHQPVLLFLRDPYVLPKANDDFPNVVIDGILHGIFYPHLLPRLSTTENEYRRENY
uniref:Sorting nexin 24 n=2 Tax=Taeniopygia guttata TaxID=59729 RepID=A0A674H327_TAEGU